jgi:hypothetical protein
MKEMFLADEYEMWVIPCPFQDIRCQYKMQNDVRPAVNNTSITVIKIKRKLRFRNFVGSKPHFFLLFVACFPFLGSRHAMTTKMHLP